MKKMPVSQDNRTAHSEWTKEMNEIKANVQKKKPHSNTHVYDTRTQKYRDSDQQFIGTIAVAYKNTRNCDKKIKK